MKQVTLFGETADKRLREIEEHNKRCDMLRRERREKGENETGLLDINCSFPCKKALQYPIGEERQRHIMNCDECKRLERELDLQLGVKNHIYS